MRAPVPIAIVGSQNYPQLDAVREVVDRLAVWSRAKERPILILTRTDSGRGPRRGVDDVARTTAQLRLLPMLAFDARWDLFGDEAGPQRNAWLVEEAHCVVAFWDPQSRGTADLVRKAIAAGKLEKVYGPDGAPLDPSTIDAALNHVLG